MISSLCRLELLIQNFITIIKTLQVNALYWLAGLLLVFANQGTYYIIKLLYNTECSFIGVQ